MRAVIVGNIDRSLVEEKNRYESIVQIDSASKMSSLDLDDTELIIAHEALNTLLECLALFETIPDERIIVSVWGNQYRLSDEDNVLEAIRLKSDTMDLASLKSANQALIAFDFIRRRSKANGLPNYIQLETTSYCNARCVMCSHYYTGNDGARHIDQKLIDTLLKDLGACYVVSLNGMGEPFVHPQIKEIIKNYEEQQIFLITNTNLSVLSKELLDLIDKNFISIELSCDGATKETYESIRINLSFDVFIHNLTLLKEHCPRLEKSINMVIMRRNVHEMCQMVKMAANFGVSFVSFTNLQPNYVVGYDADSMVNYPKVLDYYCQQAYALARRLGVTIVCPVPEKHSYEKNDDVDLEESKMRVGLLEKSEVSISEMKQRAEIIRNEMVDQEIFPSEKRCLGICEWVLNRAYIDLNGNTSICCVRQLFKTGRIDELHPLRSVWNSERYQKIRSIFYSGRLPNCCVNCGLLATNKIQYLKVLEDD